MFNGIFRNLVVLLRYSTNWTLSITARLAGPLQLHNLEYKSLRWIKRISYIAHDKLWIPRACMLRIAIQYDIIEWNNFPCYWPFVRGIHRTQVNSPHKGQSRGALMFLDLRLNIRLSKQPWGWWFETSSRLIWRHCSNRFYSNPPCR